ncbi:hypothetical protein U9M48_030376 [Paspalum notatum var. saurae]|uniref:NB-ARC domain-containing protein n=1 Tax=Paspalum notatum var. saurae TaxID=547442 RepID=A0AAQ3U0L8_PASNO
MWEQLARPPPGPQPTPRDRLTVPSRFAGDMDATRLPRGRQGEVAQLRAHVSIAHKMKKMRQRLEKIKEEAKLDIFNFKADCCSLNENVNSRATFSSTSEDIVGRAMEKETIVSMLTAYSTEEILTVSIYGFGGLGKTTLARLAFNDENVGRVFDYQAWVYVSMKFDLKKIGESILSEIGVGNCGHANLQEVTRHLQRVLAGKKFLVVLDDLWEENGFQLLDLKAMLNGGAKGSKIIVTTRSEKIASLMHPCMPYKMDVLSDEDCWILFKRRAFVPGRNDPRIEGIGRDIVKKCNGVPLSVQALGFTLRFKEGMAAWEAVRDSEIWEIENQIIMPSLKLSYFMMPCHLRLCFAYCAVFSKGAIIDRDMLIQQWIALGLIQPASGSLIPEKLGEEYVHELVSMSFLQTLMISSSVANHHMKAARVFQMHDLVYDLARCVANEEFLFMDAKRSGTPSVGRDDYRYTVLMNYNEMPMNSKSVLGKARSLHFRDCKGLQISGRSLSMTLSKFLRVLDISGCSILELPSQLNQMKQLHYLDASGMESQTKYESFTGLKCLSALNLSASYFQELPVQIGTLHKLHYLNLHGCSRLMLIPEAICKLMDLVHLDLSQCINLRVLPQSFGKLHNLLFLDMSGCLNLVSLPESFCDLCCLEHLNLSSCHDLRELPLSLGNLQQLIILDMSNCHKIRSLPISLCSLLHLEDLNLSSCYELQELPEDFGKVHGLRILDLSDCHRLQTLPGSFTDLINLEKLILCDCWELRKLPESFGNLQKIQILDLSCCSQLVALPESLTKITNLEHLNLSCCFSLEMMPGYYGCLKKLKVLNISYCFNIYIPEGISNLCDLKSLLAVGLDNYSCSNQEDCNCVSSLTQMPEIDLSEKDSLDNYEILKHKKLNLVGIGNVQNIDEVEKFALHLHQQLNTLRLGIDYLNIDEVANIVPYGIALEKLIPPRTLEYFELFGYIGSIFPEWMLNLATVLPNLVHLRLILATCDHLPPLGQLPKLQSLVIKHLPNVKDVGEVFSGDSRPFLKLRHLNISNMPNLGRWLTTISTSDEEERVCVFPNLHHLKVSQCPKLRFEPSIPECFLLEIDDCDEILLGQPETPSQPHSMPTKIKIDSCELSSLGGHQLQLFTSFDSLKFLSIATCEGLSSWGESIGALASLEVLELSLCDIPMFLERVTSLRTLSISMCHIPCDFTQHLLQLSFLKELNMTSCAAAFELPNETTRAILALIPEINLFHVGCIRCIKQKNGILYTCETVPTGQEPSGGAKTVKSHTPLRIKRPIKVPRLRLRHHKRASITITYVGAYTRSKNKAPSSRQRRRHGGNFEREVSMADWIDLIRMQKNSFHFHSSMAVRQGFSRMSLSLF